LDAIQQFEILSQTRKLPLECACKANKREEHCDKCRNKFAPTPNLYFHASFPYAASLTEWMCVNFLIIAGRFLIWFVNRSAMVLAAPK
jgi:hypothetical protein